VVGLRISSTGRGFTLPSSSSIPEILLMVNWKGKDSGSLKMVRSSED
jgi:hypothetical protein